MKTKKSQIKKKYSKKKYFKNKCVIFDFDQCLMKEHWFSLYKNYNPEELNKVIVKLEDFGLEKDIIKLFRKLKSKKIKIIIASFGKREIIKHVLKLFISEGFKIIDLKKINGIKKFDIAISTPSDILVPSADYYYSDGMKVIGDKNPQLDLIKKKLHIKNIKKDMIFFDDSPDNITGAKSEGYTAHQVEPFSRLQGLEELKNFFGLDI